METSKKSKNIFINIFSNKLEITIITFIFYLFWVLYQILKLIWWFFYEPRIENLLFFSFSNSINDFLIILGIAIIFFILSIAISTMIYTPIKVCLNFINIKLLKRYNNQITIFFSCSVFFLLTFFIVTPKASFFTHFLVFITFFAAIIFLTYYKKIIEKRFFYMFFSAFYSIFFFVMLYWSLSYYWCFKVEKNLTKKDCVLLKYKNDKYWFTRNWEIYKLDDFKYFYTNFTKPNQ